MKDVLNKNTETLLCEFWNFSKKTEELLKQLDVTARLPIDIQGIAQKLGFCVIKCPTLEENFYGCAIQKTITLKENLSYKEKQWVIAKVIANFLMNNGEHEKIVYVFNPFFISPNVDEFYSDALAMLLLLPISLFKKEVSENIGKSSDLLQEMSDKSQVSIFQMSRGYQLISQMLCFERNKEFEKLDYDITKVPSDQYENIFI